MGLKERIVEKIKEPDLKNNVIFPSKNLLIEITNYCNNKCVFCYYDCMRRKKRFINKELCERILKEAYNLGMREVGFYVVGEPLVDKRLADFVMFANKLGYEYIYITTNGILADIEKVKKLYNCGLNSIKYSINATNRREYQMIHGTDNFDKVMKNLIEVYNWKKQNNKNLKVYVSFITIDITNKVEKIKKLFRGKCDEYIIMPAINQGGLMPDISKISSKDISDLNGEFEFPCRYPFNSVVVTAEGYLTACCMDFENMLAYADLNKTSLKESWNNQLIKNFRKKHLEKKSTGTICDNCIYNIKNEPVPLNYELCKLNDKKIKFKCIEEVELGENGSNK